MIRSNSGSRRNGAGGGGEEGRDPGAGSSERDTLLSPGETPNISRARTPDLESGQPGSRSANGKGKGIFGNGAGRGKKRRNSNDRFLPSSRGSYTPIEQRRILAALLLLLVPIVIVIYYLVGVRHPALPSAGKGGDPNIPSTNPNNSDPHVVIPVKGGFTLPPPTGLPRNEAFFTSAEHGAVASEEETCSRFGVDVLKRGGNAVDSVITTCLCIGLLNSFSSGLGGGGFMVIRAPPLDESRLASSGYNWSTSSSYTDPSSSPFLGPLKLLKSTNESTLIAIDFRESAPSAAHQFMYSPSHGALAGSSQVGGLAVGVPGELRGLYTAYEMFGSGRLSWEELVVPVEELARGGWRVSRELARRFRIFGSFMKGLPEWEKVYRPRGDMLVEGDFITRTNYSQTLSAVAKYGPDVFYGRPAKSKKSRKDAGEEWIAENLIETIQRNGGVMTREDLRDYQVRLYEPVKGVYNGKRIWTTDAPSCGPVMLGMFNILSHFNLHTSHKHPEKTRTGLNMHRLTEAMKFAFGARTEISDSDDAYIGKERKERLKSFSEEGWAKSALKNLTDDSTHTAEYYNPVFDSITDSGTTHMSVVDEWGGAVSLTSTVNLIFGSRVMDPATGIILNDEQDDFSVPGKVNAFGLRSSPYNYPEPGKRPLSSTAASIVEYDDGSFYTAVGGSGGSRIFGAVAQVLLNMEWGMDVMNAIEAPRLHDQLFPAMVTIETDFEDEFVDALKSRGHNVTAFDINLGVAEVQAVVRHLNGTFTAASDSRKHGRAWGY